MAIVMSILWFLAWALVVAWIAIVAFVSFMAIGFTLEGFRW